MKVLGINCSPRKGGNTELLIYEVFKALEKEGIKTELFHLGGKKVSGCIACMKCRKKRDGKCHQKNEVIIFQILDPMERSFGFGKDAIFKDLETDEELTTQPYQIQKAYQQAMNEFTNKIKRECLNSNFDYNLLDTSTPFDKALFSYIQKRSRLH